jgi:hypothetical protein
VAAQPPVTVLVAAAAAAAGRLGGAGSWPDLSLVLVQVRQYATPLLCIGLSF